MSGMQSMRKSRCDAYAGLIAGLDPNRERIREIAELKVSVQHLMQRPPRWSPSGTRNGAIHILDYKSGARHEKPIAQLMTYALALSQRTGLELFDFVCAWFDEDSYFEFYPRHVVEKRRQTGLS